MQTVNTQPIFKVCRKQPSLFPLILLVDLSDEGVILNSLIGFPQFGHLSALFDISLPHSLQLIKAILLIFIIQLRFISLPLVCNKGLIVYNNNYLLYPSHSKFAHSSFSSKFKVASSG